VAALLDQDGQASSYCCRVQVVPEHIQLRQIAHFTCAAPAYGPGVAERLGVISKVPGRRIAAFAGLG
jgi:hypothetical protein